MIEVILKGGLGNQMFEYSAARHLGIKYNKNLVLNTEYFSNIPKGDVPRKYQLDIFHIDKNIKLKETVNPIFRIIQKIVLKFSNKFFGEKAQIVFSKLMLRLDLPVYLNGYFQNEKYFKDDRDILIKEFTLTKKIGEEAKRLKGILEKSEGVCLNVRRGDYLRPDYIKIFGVLGMEYYQEALKQISDKVKNPLFCVFSDDPEWVKKEFKIDNVIFAGTDILKDYEQMYLMSLCKHNIIANSSFAWWGAWLNQNPNKIVIAPKQWAANRTSDDLDILPTGWIKI